MLGYWGLAGKTSIPEGQNSVLSPSLKSTGTKKLACHFGILCLVDLWETFWPFPQALRLRRAFSLTKKLLICKVVNFWTVTSPANCYFDSGNKKNIFRLIVMLESFKLVQIGFISNFDCFSTDVACWRSIWSSIVHTSLVYFLLFLMVSVRYTQP